MNTLLATLHAIPVAMLVGSLWLLLCNHRTYKHRRAMIPKVGDPQFWEKMLVRDAVTYEQHLWALFRFSDPQALYEQRRSEFEEAIRRPYANYAGWAGTSSEEGK